MAKIEERKNGPLMAREVPNLKGADGAALAVKPVMALCRCGGSANKPFCDGSHNSNGFSSANATDDRAGRVYAYDGAGVTVHWNRLLCSHAAECGKRLPQVFDTAKKPWIQPDNGPVEAIREVVAACPSGALTIAEGGERHAIDDDTVEVVVEKNGPYRVRGVELVGVTWADGATPRKYVLCRCGQSKNKPFCDGTHRDIGWTDDRG